MVDWVIIKMDKNLFDKNFRLRKDLISSEIKKELILLDAKKGVYFKTNEVGSYILKTLNEAQSFQSILNKIIQEYESPEASCKTDLEIFLSELINKDIVEII